MDKKNKNIGFSLTWVLIIVVITSIVSALTTGVIVYNNNKITSKVTYADLSEDKSLNEFLQVYASIISEYYEDIDKDELLSKAIAAMMNYLGDDYTTYLDDENTNDLVNSLSGEYQGIGVSINNSDKSISTVYEDTPAYRAGIKEGDIIIAFNGEDVTAKSTSELVNEIKSTSGKFTLTLKRGEEEITVTLSNEKILSPNIEYRLIDDTKTGYLKIDTFSKTLETQVRKALTKLEKENMENLIIDLRDNTGGYLDAAYNVASLFIAKDKIIYSLDYKNNVTNYTDKTDEHKNYDIIVLLNKNSAALKESYGAKIVGETSFGKGRVQQTMELENGGMVKYTSAYWLTPKGDCIDKKGITPDYPISNENITDEEDNILAIIDRQLEKAIKIFNPNLNIDFGKNAQDVINSVDNPNNSSIESNDENNNSNNASDVNNEDDNKEE